MSKRGKQLTHSEIWDDSALINNWNEALAEYKARASFSYYHSLHVRGETVEQALAEADAEEAAEAGAASGVRANGKDGLMDEDEAEDGEIGQDQEDVGGDEDVAMEAGWRVVDEDEAVADTPHARIFGASSEPRSAMQQPPMPPLAGVPNAVLGSMGDEAMKNLMMSWYYAGYYTGFYEGQRQGTQADTAPGAQASVKMPK